MGNEKRLIDAIVVRHKIDAFASSVVYRGSALMVTGKDSCNPYEYTRGYEQGVLDATNIVMGQETVDAVEVVHGWWIDVALRYTQTKEKCSVCGGIVYAHGFNYCPNCGAKMDGEREDDHE